MLALSVILALPALAQEAGFVALFDGKTLNGWTQLERKGPGYIVENGMLVCPVDGGGNIFTEKEYANFVVRFEFRMQEGGNNGLGIRAPLSARTAYEGMEIQILDDGHAKYQGRIKPVQYHGSVYGVIPAKRGFLRKAGEWNQEEVTANGRRITVKLNGTVILDADLDTVKDPAILKEHPGLARASGHIGFLGHDDRMDFRDIRIRVLP